MPRPAWGIRHGAGSRATTGHQNSSPTARNRTCSNSWAHSFSRARLNSGEKWAPHMTAANATQATTGWANTLTGRERRTGTIQRRRTLGLETRSNGVIGAASAMSGAASRSSSTGWTMWTENSAVSYDAIPDNSANAIAVRPAKNAIERARGTGVAGWAALTRRTARTQAVVAASNDSRTTGSNDQPRRIVETLGGSAGTGPCARTGAAATN